ncbi:MAG: hypothetical protein J5I93_16100 [Pirellulaceae bacterium]|nr:hypothetical protein [Pirellulaceae bacterium]
MIQRISSAPAVWVLDSPTETSDASGQRVQTLIAGQPLWFESPDAPLVADQAAFLLAMLFPALHRSVQLATRNPIDARLREGLQSLTSIYHQWWQYRPDAVERVQAAAVNVAAPPGRVADRATGVCFSGGVDSFYTLLAPPQPVDVLAFVHGFDIPLRDRVRWDQAERSLRGVAAALGKQSVVVRTNLREHPAFAGVSWSRAHGAALAAVGHLLASSLHTLIIPPSYRADRLCPWGSDPRTDPLYSSSRLRIEHPVSYDGRTERIRAIAAEPLAQRHLRVCYENRSRAGNCSRCEKCLLAMATLHGLGQLQAFEVFDRRVPLERRLDQLPCIAHHAPALWREVAGMEHGPAVSAALDRLLARPAPQGLRRAWCRAQRWLERRVC